VRKGNGGAGPCKILSREERDAVERQLRAQGRLRPLTATELRALRNARAVRAGGFPGLLFAHRERREWRPGR